jgi:hypothetical protein
MLARVSETTEIEFEKVKVKLELRGTLTEWAGGEAELKTNCPLTRTIANSISIIENIALAFKPLF